MSSIQILAKQFALHSRLFNNVLESVQESQAAKRLGDAVNHLQWIAGHLTNTRYNYAQMLGLDKKFPYRDLYVDPAAPPPGNRAIDVFIEYPALDEILKCWNDYAPSFAEAISKLPHVQLETEMPFSTPIGDKTVLGFLGFLASHESYHIGQMSIIRKYLGLSAMSYK
ncbi:MAG TPA: DinB family protein [Puia sp.]|nr:DinB family protein [Puia sp.]